MWVLASIIYSLEKEEMAKERHCEVEKPRSQPSWVSPMYYRGAPQSNLEGVETTLAASQPPPPKARAGDSFLASASIRRIHRVRCDGCHGGGGGPSGTSLNLGRPQTHGPRSRTPKPRATDHGQRGSPRPRNTLPSVAFHLHYVRGLEKGSRAWDGAGSEAPIHRIRHGREAPVPNSMERRKRQRQQRTGKK